MAFAPSPYQQQFFEWLASGRGSAVMCAVAGSGKSTTLGYGLTYLPASASVQVFAFNASIARDFKARIERLAVETGHDMSRVRAGTFHSVGFGAILKHLNLPANRMVVDGKKCPKLLRDRFTPVENEVYGSFAAHLVSLAKGEGIGALVPDTDDAWYNLISHHDLYLEAEEATVDGGIDVARRLLAMSNDVAREGHIDFDDQLYLVCLWRLRLWQNDVVFVDEAQDTNRVRRAIAKLALRPGGRLVAVGDARQAIYGFTGASHDAIDLIKREFNCCELPLTISYRCAKAIAVHAAELVPYFEAHAGAPEGRVDQAIALDDALKVLDGHDAVLCRNVKPLIDLAYTLIGRGVGCYVLGREIGDGLINLTKKMKARGIDNLAQKLAAYEKREVAAFVAKGEEGKAEAVSDRVACITTIIGQMDENNRTVPALISRIETLFSEANGVLTLSTVHKAKGREWRRVAILAPELMPSKWARQDWQQKQEENLMYVARTRAIEHLMYLV